MDPISAKVFLKDENYYYCHYCDDFHRKDKFDEFYPRCYWNNYTEDPVDPKPTLEKYLARCNVLGIGPYDEDFEHRPSKIQDT